MKKIFAVVLAACFPLISFAQPKPNTNYVNDLITEGRDILNIAIPILMTLATIWFIWTVIQFMRADDKARAEKRNNMIAGIIGLAVMITIWGLVRLLAYTFGLDATQMGPITKTIPCPPGTSWSETYKRCQ